MKSFLCRILRNKLFFGVGRNNRTARVLSFAIIDMLVAALEKEITRIMEEGKAG